MAVNDQFAKMPDGQLAVVPAAVPGRDGFDVMLAPERAVQWAVIHGDNPARFELGDVAGKLPHFVFRPAVVVRGLGVVIRWIQEHEIFRMVVVEENSAIIERLDEHALHALGEFPDRFHEGFPRNNGVRVWLATYWKGATIATKAAFVGMQEKTCTLDIGEEIGLQDLANLVKELSTDGHALDLGGQCLGVIFRDSVKIDHIAVDVVVDFEFDRRLCQKECGPAAEYFDVASFFRDVR